MPSKKVVLKGCQEPRVKLVPRAVDFDDGEDAIRLSTSYGLTPDPWQAAVLNAWLARDRQGQFAASRCGLMVPRQNGKNGVIEMRELFGTSILGEKFLHTAHEVKTARKAFSRLCSFFENERKYPELAELVQEIRRTNGQEAIVLTNGGSVEFVARSRGSGRGYTVDVVICDEAQEMTDEQLEALMPTMSAAPLGNPQLILTGTPPKPGFTGEVLRRMRDSAHEKKDKSLAWHEWSVDNIGDVEDRTRWEDTNPALGYRLRVREVETELAQMSEDGFARERMGWWAEGSTERAISEEMWASLHTDNPAEEGKIAYGIKFSIDGSVVSVAAAVKPTEGTPHVELIHNEPTSHGTTWLSDWLKDRELSTALVVVDGNTGAAGALIEKLNQEKYKKRALKTTSSKEVATAASFLLDAIKEKRITHISDPTLDSSAVNSTKRKIGEGWGFGSDGITDPSPIEAVSLAYWGVMTTRRDPSRKVCLL